MKFPRASATETTTGKLVPTVHKQPLKSSAATNWDGIIIEQHRLAPRELREISLHHHSISIKHTEKLDEIFQYKNAQVFRIQQRYSKYIIMLELQKLPAYGK